jgi:branched-chain amino acid transport system substrate-binding protein
VEILKRMGPSLDRAAIKNAVESIHNWDLGIGTPVSFDAHKHQGLDNVYFTVAQDGKFVRIDDWKRWAK